MCGSAIRSDRSSWDRARIRAGPHSPARIIPHQPRPTGRASRTKTLAFHPPPRLIRMKPFFSRIFFLQNEKRNIVQVLPRRPEAVRTARNQAIQLAVRSPPPPPHRPFLVEADAVPARARPQSRIHRRRMYEIRGAQERRGFDQSRTWGDGTRRVRDREYGQFPRAPLYLWLFSIPS